MSAATKSRPAPSAVAEENPFNTIPPTTLPSGLVVPTFQVARYLCSKGTDGKAAVTREGAPWVRITYAAARQACVDAGFALLTETQALALAIRATQIAGNWTKGKVGEGNVYQGLHAWTVSSAQPATYESKKKKERRWFELEPGGERIFDLAGNAYTWIFDDVQGDADGLVAKAFAPDSPSISTPPYPKLEKGMGWYPDAGSDWSGSALIRGGCWSSGSDAGVFGLDGGWPGDAYDNVGFRCTKPGL